MAARFCLYQLSHHVVSAASPGLSLVRSFQKVKWLKIAAGIRKPALYGAARVPSYTPKPIDHVASHGAALQRSCSCFCATSEPCVWSLSNHDGPSAADSKGQARWSLVSSVSKVTLGWLISRSRTSAANASS